MWQKEIEMRLGDPTARVTCLDPSGSSTLELHDLLAPYAAQIQPTSGPLDLFEPADRANVVKAFTVAKFRGTGTVEARLLTGETKRIDLYDEEAALGCFVVILGEPSGSTMTIGDQAIDLKARTASYNMDATGVILWAHPDVEAVFGWAPSELVGRSALELTHPDDHERGFINWIDVLDRGAGARLRTRRRFLTKDGHWRWVEGTSTNHLDHPEQGYVSSDLIDISDEMAALDEARRRDALLTRLTEALPTGVLHINAERLPIFWNQRWTQLLSNGSPSIEGLLTQLVESDEVAQAIDRSFSSGVDADLDVTIISADDQRYGRLHLRPLEHADGRAEVLITLEDNTTAREYQQGLHDLAHRDSLTGVLGRLGSRTIVEDLLASSSASRALLFVDLDGFKQINDTYGHATGDAVLRAVAHAITSAVRLRDAVARIGGDEFVVTVRGASSPDEVVERIHRALRDAESTIDQPVKIRASIGTAEVKPADDFDSLLRRADQAMYQIKRAEQDTADSSPVVTPAPTR